MPRSRRRHRSRSHSRTRSHSVGSPQYEHKRRRIDYESPQSKGTYSGERVLRSRQHERGTSQERRYKRSHRRSPSSGRQHGHRDRDRDRAHLAHPTSSRRTRLHRHHGSSSPSQERHRHRSPSTRSQVSPRDNMSHLSASVYYCSCRFTAPRDTTDDLQTVDPVIRSTPMIYEDIYSRRLSYSVVFINDVINRRNLTDRDIIWYMKNSFSNRLELILKKKEIIYYIFPSFVKHQTFS